jgi:hypothetical protein
VLGEVLKRWGSSKSLPLDCAVILTPLPETVDFQEENVRNNENGKSSGNQGDSIISCTQYTAVNQRVSMQLTYH